MSSDAVETVRFHATRHQWRILEVGGTTLGLLAPQLSDASVRRVLADATSGRAVIEHLAGSTEFAAFSHDPVEGFRLHTDVNRSFPLYWRRDGDAVDASDDHRVLASLPEQHRCTASMEEFAHSGFTVGTRTMHDEVMSVPADAEVLLDTPSAPPLDRSRIALPGPGAVVDPEDAGRLFVDALHTAVETLVSENPDAHFLLPLSGGSDSRLLALVLREVSPARLTAFTYGVPRSAEVGVSRAVAEALRIPWTSIELSTSSIRRQWSAPANASFLADAHAGNALPHIQDWYAVSRMRETGLVAEDTIVLPGHTAARTYAPPALPARDGAWSREQILDTLLAQHFNQRSGVPSQEPLLSHLALALDAELPAGHERFDELTTARLIQSFNIQHRQVKYILNSARTYEHFSARWSTPLLDPRCHRALNTVDWTVRRSKDWYRAVTDQEMRRLAGERADRVAPLTRDPSRTAATATQLAGVRHRAGALTRSAQTVATNLRHPMAFEAYAPSRREYVGAIARRFSPLGVFAEAFLEGRWNPSYRWDDSDTWNTPAVISLSQFSVTSTAP